ncbi:protein CHROMATIN REMODELING 35-like isoform X2 [Neltuma alba]|uniref:protein CHROMATIN REMODELING 35-like isoform X2 n=1 Tax=Neltuma alba TaxID=207710 RepID=UPI0010A36A66|nr:protein CHROMATIN REMODELING 35-like isoform X2 [Prosopis alba]XP_028768113.1 protein CHROMATIN REMODELING 35-like isoform X2 [Prosopis alba]
MESPAVGVLPAKRPANGFNLEKHKRLKVVDYSNPYAIADLLDGLNHGKFGSVTKDIESLIAQKMQTLSPIFAKDPALLQFVKVGMNHNEDTAKKIIDLEDNLKTKTAPKASSTVVIIDSDEEDDRDKKPFLPFQEVVLPKPVVPPTTKDMVYHGPNAHPSIGCHAGILGVKPELSLVGEDNIEKDKGAFIGVQGEDNPQADTKGDELDDIWREMSMAIECSKDDAMDSPHDEAEKGGGDCDHSYVLKDDLGYVCRVCGVIDRGIETIFEFQYKVKKSTRTYAADSWNAKERTAPEVSGLKFGEDGLVITEISAHPRHMKQMKPHQIEGFNFLVRNLAGDNPGGCILAHAPGSGKTFMIISFMQSFLGKYPQAHPLVVLPKGILATWKKEFQTWQVEDIPLYDFYSAKADSRSQQLEVLKQWVEQKSILFLGYKQFSSIVCDTGTSPVSVTCQKILLEAPSILILDEGHTPRNDNTDIVQSLTKVQTPRKVVLSGTLYQNHVKEVFNILNIVRPPNFLRSQTSRPIVRRIKSRVHVPGVKDFCDLVENTLQKDPDFKRKVAVIQDLREMTSQVLHYYKGDFLDELPGLVDFAVVLNLTPRQKHEVHKLKHLSRKFKISSVGSAVYLHAKLKPMAENCAENSAVSDQMMDEKIESIDVEDGVKSKFFLKMLNLCESSGEKLLVFSQYLLPLKYLERLTVKRKGWSPGKEIFVISGESSSEQREWSMERFNNSPDAKVFFGSIKACGEGISLVGASRIIILDVHLNPSVTRQAIGRAFRPGQTKKVFAYRLIAADSPEQEDHDTCFKKELISKMWFEWNEYCGFRDFEVETVNVEQCDDFFLQSPLLRDDIKILHRRP